HRRTGLGIAQQPGPAALFGQLLGGQVVEGLGVRQRGVVRNVLPGDADDAGQEHQRRIARRLGRAGRVVQRVGDDDTWIGLQRDGRVLERADVAVGVVQQIETEALMLVVATQVQRVVRGVPGGVRAVGGHVLAVVVRAQSLTTAGRSTTLLLGAGATARVVRIRFANLGGLRHAAVGTHEPAYLVVTNRAVVLVREHDDRDQRVRTQELFTLLEQDVVTARAGAERAVFVHHQGGATHRGRTLLGDVRWRLGVDQEAVPRLERRFVTATVLANRSDLVLERFVQVGRVGLTRRAVLGPGGVPSQKAGAVVAGDARAHGRDQPSLVVQRVGRSARGAHVTAV